MSNSLSIEELAQQSKKIRINIIEMLLKSGSGHTAGSLGLADIFTALYFQSINHKPRDPWWRERDYVLVSNGHICPVWYATLAQAGYFDKSELTTLRQIDTRLQGHPHYRSLPGIENTSGPLGQGLSQAVGIALGLKMDNRNNQVFVISSDGEQQEGQTWEAYMLAAAKKLDNLTVLIDDNNIQISGTTEQTLNIQPLDKKLTSFGFDVQIIDGHNFQQIISACHQASQMKNKPSAIICKTIPGKGVSFMENDYHWHGKAPSREEAEKAIKEISN